MQLKNYIELILDPVFIFSKYLKIKPHIIEKSINIGNTFRNPLRHDRTPSASFKFINGTLKLRDYARPEYSGDVYQCVGIILGLDCNNGKDFVTICNHIIENLIQNKEVFNTYTISNVVALQRKGMSVSNRDLSKITVEYSTWNKDTFAYWYQLVTPNKSIAKILIKVLQRYSIYPIDKFWLNNNKRATRMAKKNKPLYAYLLNINIEGNKFKIYSPYDDTIKFFTNHNAKFNYLNMLNNTKIGVLTKSIKDFVLLTTIAEYLKVDDLITFIPVNSESTVINRNDYIELINKYQKLYTFFDWDETGIKSAFRLKTLFEIDSIFITNDIFKVGEMKMFDIQPMLDTLNKTAPLFTTPMDFYTYVKSYKIKYYDSKDVSDFAMTHGIKKTIGMFKVMFNLLKLRQIK